MCLGKKSMHQPLWKIVWNCPSAKGANRQSCKQPACSQPCAAPIVFCALDHPAKVECPQVIVPLGESFCLRKLRGPFIHLTAILFQ
jgi:hypothetical protein